jgi:hypothetical protein
MQVAAATEAAKRSTRQPVSVDKVMELPPVDSDQTRIRLNNCDKPIPRTVPDTASNALSVNDCQNNRGRDAPNAIRTAISRSRPLARASSKFAKFAHAISNTNPVIVSNNQSDESYSSRSQLTPAPAGNAPNL